MQGLGLKQIADQLYSLIEVGRKAGEPINTELFLTGILPTITMADLTFVSMTPIERYKVLSQELLNLRGEKFEIFLEGVDDVKLKLRVSFLKLVIQVFNCICKSIPQDFSICTTGLN